MFNPEPGLCPLHNHSSLLALFQKFPDSVLRPNQIPLDTTRANSLTNLHPQVTTPLSNPLLGSSLQSPLELQVVDTLPDGFTVSSTLGCWLLPVSPPNSNPVDEVTLLGLVTQSPSLVGSGRSGCSVDNGELSVFPTSYSRDELENVTLLLGVKLL